jgi:hypothetical protein
MNRRHLRQQFDTGHVRQPLLGQHQRHVRAGLGELPQRGERSLPRRMRHDLVIRPKPPLQAPPKPLD